MNTPRKCLTDGSDCGSNLCPPAICPKCDEDLCRFGKCHECGDLCDEHAEAAYERWLENYYGGNGPQTDREREEVRRRQP